MSTPKGRERKIRAWAVVEIKTGDIQVSTTMSSGLRKFYNKTKTMICVPCEISYKLPNIKNK